MITWAVSLFSAFDSDSSAPDVFVVEFLAFFDQSGLLDTEPEQVAILCKIVAAGTFVAVAW